MLCPEVWNFKAPESTFHIENHHLDQCNNFNTTNNFIYNHLVSVTIPDTFKVPESLTEALINDCDYYRVNDVKLDEFISKTFVNSFVNNGTLYVLSIGTRIDCDNCIGITPKGKLILSLDKATYQGSGLEGDLSHFHSKTKERYIVTIDLTLSHFKPGKPNYERTKKCLENLFERFNIIVTWEPPAQDVCPSTIAKYFDDLGYETKQCKIRYHAHTLYFVKTPPEDPEEFVEWLGLVSLNADFENAGPDNYVNSYDLADADIRYGQVKCLQWRGFFTFNQILNLVSSLRRFKESNAVPWISIYVQGFSDSPVAWGSNEHHYYTNGDNGYILIIKEKELVLCAHKCSRKQYLNKRKNSLY